jgi:hypothetical protein
MTDINSEDYNILLKIPLNDVITTWIKFLEKKDGLKEKELLRFTEQYIKIHNIYNLLNKKDFFFDTQDDELNRMLNSSNEKNDNLVILDDNDEKDILKKIIVGVKPKHSFYLFNFLIKNEEQQQCYAALFYSNAEIFFPWINLCSIINEYVFLQMADELLNENIRNEENWKNFSISYFIKACFMVFTTKQFLQKNTQFVLKISTASIPNIYKVIIFYCFMKTFNYDKNLQLISFLDRTVISIPAELKDSKSISKVIEFFNQQSNSKFYIKYNYVSAKTDFE